MPIAILLNLQLTTNYSQHTLRASSISGFKLIEYPVSSIQYPASSIQHRVSTIEHRASRIEYKEKS
jgi:hypothetical protein